MYWYRTNDDLLRWIWEVLDCALDFPYGFGLVGGGSEARLAGLCVILRSVRGECMGGAESWGSIELKMLVLMTLLALGGAWLQTSRWLRLEPAPALAVAVAALLAVLFVGGMLGALDASVWLLRVCGLVALVIGAHAWARSPSRVVPQLEIVLPMALLAGFWALHHSATYFYYDEFAHWGIFLKDMLARGDFWGADTNAMHPRYLPGATLWQYFFCQGLPGTYVDNVAYLAQFILLCAPLSLLWGRLDWQEWPWALGLLVVVILGLAAFSPGVTSLYVDHLLSAWFLGSLLLYLNLREEGGWRVALVCLPLLVLALIKEVGLALVMAAAAALAVEAFWRLGRKGIFRPALLAAALLLPALAATLVWNAQRDALGLEHSIGSAAAVVAAVLGQGEDPDPALAAETDRRFMEVVINQQLGNSAVSWQYNEFSYALRGVYTEPHRLSPLGFLFAWAVVWVLIVLILPTLPQRTTAIWLGLSLTLTLAAYVLMLWTNYRSVWGELGLGLPSLLRYLHVLVLPMFLLCFWIMTPSYRSAESTGSRVESPSGKPRQPYLATLFVVLLAAYAWLEPPFLRPLFHSVSAYPMRDATEEVAGKVRALAGNGRVWVFLPNDQPNEFLGRFLQFQLSPTPTSVERSMDFWDGEPARVKGTLSKFEVIWFPAEGYRLDTAAEVVGSATPAGIYVRQPDGRFAPAFRD